MADEADAGRLRTRPGKAARWPRERATRTTVAGRKASQAARSRRSIGRGRSETGELRNCCCPPFRLAFLLPRELNSFIACLRIDPPDPVQSSRPMTPRRLPLFLIVALCLSAGSSGDQSGPRSCRVNCGKVAADLISTPLVARTASPSPSLLRLTPWRYRLKSVVETSDPRSPEPVALGRAPVLEPDHLILPVARSPRIARSRALVPLRC